MTRRSIALVATLLVGVTASAARAGISSVGSGIQVQAPTLTSDTGGNNELDRNEYESNTQIRVWFERTVTINQSMELDHVTAGASGTGTFDANADLNNATLATNTALDSYYLMWDPVTANTAIVDSSGSLSITFDSDILGLALDDNGIAAGAVGMNESDDASGDANGNQAFQGPGALTYRNHAGRSFELGTATNRDSFSISSDRRTLTILRAFDDNGNHDNMRIFVSASAVVPEPGTLALFGVGASGLAGWIALRRRRVRAATRDRA